MERRKGVIGGGVLGEGWEAELTERMGNVFGVIPLCLPVSARLRSHGAALHRSASVAPLLSCLCSNITFFKMFRGSNLQPPSVELHIPEADRPNGDDYIPYNLYS